jgi:hypothetical protein
MATPRKKKPDPSQATDTPPALIDPKDCMHPYSGLLIAENGPTGKCSACGEVVSVLGFTDEDRAQ